MAATCFVSPKASRISPLPSPNQICIFQIRLLNDMLDCFETLAALLVVPVRNATKLIAVVVEDGPTTHHLTSFPVHSLHAQIEAEMGQLTKNIFWRGEIN